MYTRMKLKWCRIETQTRVQGQYEDRFPVLSELISCSHIVQSTCLIVIMLKHAVYWGVKWVQLRIIWLAKTEFVNNLFSVFQNGTLTQSNLRKMINRNFIHSICFIQSFQPRSSVPSLFGSIRTNLSRVCLVKVRPLRQLRPINC